MLYAPALLGVPRAMIASWGQIELVPVDKDALRVAGQSSEMSDVLCSQRSMTTRPLIFPVRISAAKDGTSSSLA